MTLQRTYVFLLVLTLLVPMTVANLIPQAEDDVVCELLEDLSEEEEGDDKSETSLDETTFLRFNSCSVELQWEQQISSTAAFSQTTDLPSGIPQEISTPPPEYTMS